jgi:hypothetical protein
MNRDASRVGWKIGPGESMTFGTRITRARLSGPEQVTKDATIAEMAADGTMTGLVKGKNEWVCTPGMKTKSATIRCA